MARAWALASVVVVGAGVAAHGVHGFGDGAPLLSLWQAEPHLRQTPATRAEHAAPSVPPWVDEGGDEFAKGEAHDVRFARGDGARDGTETRGPAAASRRLVVLLTLDGVRWQEVFHGVDPELGRRHRVPLAWRTGAATLVPHLTALARRGVALGRDDAPLVAGGPVYKSIPGYLEIFHGRSDHGCVSNGCAPPPGPSVLDDVQRSGATVGLFTSWPHVGRAALGPRSAVTASLGARAGHGLAALLADPELAELHRLGVLAGPLPGADDFRQDRWTAELALSWLIRADPGLLVVSLGETDEFAHLNLYTRYLEALGNADAFVGRLQYELELRRAQGWETALLVTTDHGRDARCRDHGRDPASRRVWLVAAGSLVRNVQAPRHPEQRLAQVAPTVRALMGLEPRGTPLAGLLRGDGASGERRVAADAP